MKLCYILSGLLLLCLVHSLAFGYDKDYTDENCIRAIIGESSNQGFHGMYAAATAFYGLYLGSR